MSFSDSGGPSVAEINGSVSFLSQFHDNFTTKFIKQLAVIGIVSWGSSFPCGSVNSVSVYVRTSAFIDWINAKIQ